jgi:hypothetical protein
MVAFESLAATDSLWWAPAALKTLPDVARNVARTACRPLGGVSSSEISPTNKKPNCMESDFAGWKSVDHERFGLSRSLRGSSVFPFSLLYTRSLQFSGQAKARPRRTGAELGASRSLPAKCRGVAVEAAETTADEHLTPAAGPGLVKSAAYVYKQTSTYARRFSRLENTWKRPTAYRGAAGVGKSSVALLASDFNGRRQRRTWSSVTPAAEGRRTCALTMLRGGGGGWGVGGEQTSGRR